MRWLIRTTSLVVCVCVCVCMCVCVSYFNCCCTRYVRTVSPCPVFPLLSCPYLVCFLFSFSLIISSRCVIHYLVYSSVYKPCVPCVWCQLLFVILHVPWLLCSSVWMNKCCLKKDSLVLEADSPWVPERAPPWRPPVLSPCPLRPPERPPPPPRWMLYSAGCACWEGGGEDLMSELCPHVLCFPSSCAHIWSVSCSLLVLLISSQVPGVCHSLVYSSEPCVPCVWFLLVSCVLTFGWINVVWRKVPGLQRNVTEQLTITVTSAPCPPVYLFPFFFFFSGVPVFFPRWWKLPLTSLPLAA